MNLKLPPLQIIKHAILLIWRKRRFALFVSLPIILLFVTSGIGADTGTFRIFGYGNASRGDPGLLPTEAQIALHVAGILLLVVLAAMMAVYWHRSVLLDEESAEGIPLRFDAVVWRYLPYGFLISMLSMIVLVLFVAAFSSTFATFSAQQSAVGILLFILVFIVLVPLVLWLGVATFRLGLVLPAKAITRPNFGFRAAWRLSTGCGWQLLAIISLYFVVNLVLVIPHMVAFAIVNPFSVLPSTLVEFFIGVWMALHTLLGVGVLSVTYAYLTYKKAVPAPPGMT